MPGAPPNVQNKERDTATRKAVVKAAARAYRISPETLWGVYGVESAFGTNLGPSSAGAIGPFQFLPSTAASLHCDPNQFTSAARCSAKYLHQLGANTDADSPQTRNALNRYNGNGGGASETSYTRGVREKGKALAGSVIPGINDPSDIPGAGAAIGAAQDGAAAIGDVLSALTNPSTWLRLSKGFGGAVLLVVGVGGLVFVVASKSNTGKAIAGVASKTPVGTAAKAAVSAAT